MNYDIFVLEHELNLAGMNIATTEYTEEEGLEGHSDSDDEDEVEDAVHMTVVVRTHSIVTISFGEYLNNGSTAQEDAFAYSPKLLGNPLQTMESS
ncbi:MAG TPA: hypothetical protein VFY41_09405 [Nitrososphaeraceae archaeon]|nr:hypothetical protein [Nitrososphaeraceae archaeon]